MDNEHRRKRAPINALNRGQPGITFPRHPLPTGVGVTAFFCFMFSWVEQLLATTLTATNALPFAAVMTRSYSVSGMDWSMLAAAGVLIGRECSCYPAVGPEVAGVGGTYADIRIDAAHVDENLVTAPAWPAHPAWLAEFLRVLGTRIEL